MGVTNIPTNQSAQMIRYHDSSTRMALFFVSSFFGFSRISGPAVFLFWPEARGVRRVTRFESVLESCGPDNTDGDGDDRAAQGAGTCVAQRRASAKQKGRTQISTYLQISPTGNGEWAVAETARR